MTTSLTLLNLQQHPAQLENWLRGLKLALQDTQPSSHTLCKQVYFPVGDGQYHLLAPLFSSSLSQAIHQAIDHSRYSKEMAAAREARYNQQPHDKPVVAYPDLALTFSGGSKPQNISQLNAIRGGRTYLLPAQPPGRDNTGVYSGAHYRDDTPSKRPFKARGSEKVISRPTKLWF